jgi:hypothetical protein
MSNLWKPRLQHIKRVLIHKWYVFRAGIWCGVPMWRLIIHDWSKFTPTEIKGYAFKFFGGKGDDATWKRAWEHHYLWNDHHPEYWQHDEQGRPLPAPRIMTPAAVAEMVADWLGASRAYNGKWPTNFDTWEWWNNSGKDLNIHPTSRAHALATLHAVFARRGG